MYRKFNNYYILYTIYEHAAGVYKQEQKIRMCTVASWLVAFCHLVLRDCDNATFLHLFSAASTISSNLLFW